MIINKSKIDNWVVVILLILLYGYSYFPPSIRGTGAVVASLLIILSMVLFRQPYDSRNKRIYFLKLLWIAIASISLLNNNYDLSKGLYGRALYFIMPILFIVFTSDNTAWIDKAWKFISFPSIIFLFGTLLVQMIPSLSNALIHKLFSTYAENLIEMNDSVSRRYNSGFAITASINSLYLTIGLGYYLTIYISGKRKKHLALTLLFLFALYLTNKRGALLFSLLAIIIVAFASIANKSKKAIIWFVVLYTILIIVSVGLLNNVFISSNLSTLWNDTISTGRITLYIRAVELFLRNPIFGNGWLSFQYISGIFNFNGMMMVHNVYLQLLCETGIVGLAIYLVCIITGLIVSFKTLRLYSDDMYKKSYVLFSIYYQMFFILYSLTGNPLYDSVFFYSYALALGIPISIMLNTYSDVDSD